jgi:EAL domain-containing protein (putative c-di-GMP-specific phosphodiesterase class I)
MPFGLGGARTHPTVQSLRKERDLLDVMLDSVDVAVIACASDGRLTHVNRRARELVGVTCEPGSSAGTWMQKCRLRTPEGQPLLPDDLPVTRALNGNGVQRMDLLAAGNGGDVLLSASARPMVDDEGDHLGTVVVFKDVTRQRAREARIRSELRETGLALDVPAAVEAGRLVLYAQPIVSLFSGETVLEELLLRMRSADGTISAPGDFLAAAERHGTITTLDLWVFDQAAQLAAAGRPVTVNVSARTVSTPSFLEDVEATLARYRVEPSLLTLEITETAVVSDIVQVSRFADRLDKIGCHFALDDFGTGYAALTYLKHLPVRYLKIDMSFVRDLAENPRSRRVVNGVVALAASFNHETIAEGVEDPNTLQLLSELGVDLAQGFGVGEPAPIR